MPKNIGAQNFCNSSYPTLQTEATIFFRTLHFTSLIFSLYFNCHKLFFHGHFFLNASLGVETCSLDAAFVFATNRNRRGDSVFNGECCKSGHLWRFKRRAVSFRVESVALGDIPTCFMTCQKSCVTSAILLRGF